MNWQRLFVTVGGAFLMGTMFATTMCCTEKMRAAMGSDVRRPPCFTERSKDNEPMKCCYESWEDMNKPGVAPTCTRFKTE